MLGPRRWGRLMVAGAAALALTTTACAGLGAGSSSRRGVAAAGSDPAGYLRVVRTADKAWSVECINDPCSSTPRFSTNVPVPDGVMSFDLVLTVTMQYTTTRRDWGEAEVTYCPYAIPPPPCAYLTLEPGRFPLASAAMPGGATTTMTWSKKGLSAGYSAWHYQLLITPWDGSGDLAV